MISDSDSFTGGNLQVKRGKSGSAGESQLPPPKSAKITAPNVPKKSIAYVSHPAYSEQIGGPNGKLYNVILQFRIKPDTYEVGPSTLKDTPEDQYVAEEEMEWFTPRHGVHLLYGILICRTSEMRS